MCDNMKYGIENIDLPWIIFEVRNNTYAVNSMEVLSIIKMTDDVILIPDIQEYIRGVMNLRGSIIPLIDLKILFKEDSLEKIINDYSDMIALRKQDHINWVDELERCINNEEVFNLATDPHKCTFGKWYYSYKPENNTIGFQIKKIEEPHRLLHAAAEAYNNCSKDHENCNRDECLKDVVKKVKEEYMPEIISIMDESIAVLKNNLREMIIVLEHEGFKAGIVVDNVRAIETISFQYEQSDINTEYYNSKFINGVAKTDKTSTNVLTINVDNVLAKADDINLEEIEKIEIKKKSIEEKEEKIAETEVETETEVEAETETKAENA